MKTWEKFCNADYLAGPGSQEIETLCSIIDDLEKRVEALEQEKEPKWQTVESLCPNGCARQSTVRKLVKNVFEITGMVCGHTWQIDPLT